jgi:hypothetical protein
MFFKHWTECSQDLIPLDLDSTRIYYIQARAWHLKGWLGGTHSWTTFYSDEHKSWLVVEYTERETLSFQGGKIIYDGNASADDTRHAPYITTRPYNARWFGGKPYIVDSCPVVSYDKVVQACKEIPYNGFRLLDLNCNTFTSYLHWKLNLDLNQPIRSVGYRNKKYWNNYDRSNDYIHAAKY